MPDKRFHGHIDPNQLNDQRPFFFKEGLSKKDEAMKYMKTTLTAITATALLGGAALMAAPGERGMKADANKDGVITKAESLNAAEKRFAKMDANGDGVLNTSDREARAKQKFAEMDSDGNGSLSESEFLAAQKARMERREQRAANRSERGGKKGKRGGRKGKGKLAKLLKNADSNSDGAISKDEFIAATQARFAKVDTNADDQVTKEERRAARQQRRAEFKERNKG